MPGVLHLQPEILRALQNRFQLSGLLPRIVCLLQCLHCLAFWKKSEGLSILCCNAVPSTKSEACVKIGKRASGAGKATRATCARALLDSLKEWSAVSFQLTGAFSRRFPRSKSFIGAWIFAATGMQRLYEFIIPRNRRTPFAVSDCGKFRIASTFSGHLYNSKGSQNLLKLRPKAFDKFVLYFESQTVCTRIRIIRMMSWWQSLVYFLLQSGFDCMPDR